MNGTRVCRIEQYSLDRNRRTEVTHAQASTPSAGYHTRVRAFHDLRAQQAWTHRVLSTVQTGCAVGIKPLQGEKRNYTRPLRHTVMRRHEEHKVALVADTGPAGKAAGEDGH